MKKYIILIVLLFSFFSCTNNKNIENKNIENKNNLTQYKSIEININNEEKKEKLIEELKKIKPKDNLKFTNIKIENRFYDENYFNQIIENFNWNDLDFTITNVKNTDNIPFLKEKNIDILKKIKQKVNIYYNFNVELWDFTKMTETEKKDFYNKRDVFIKIKKENINKLKNKLEDLENNSKIWQFILYWEVIKI